ncbi:hypothetical protein PAXINDRAFT_90363, partial [Paxillus involutus ATCC 200175]
VAGVRRSGRQHQPANKNKEYQRTLDEEAERRANLREHDAQPQNLEPEPEPASRPPDHTPEPSEAEEELQSLNSNHVYETVLIPEGVTPITSKPVFRIKHDQHGNVERYKVRIVA